jgi:hypothetical protein
MKSTLHTIKYIVLILLFSGFSLVKGQFAPGYVITHSEDTIHGMLKDRNVRYNAKIFRKVRMKKGHFSKKYSPARIKGYCIGNNCFVSMRIQKKSILFQESYVISPFRGKPVFLKKIVEGYVSLYHLERTDGESAGIDIVELLHRNNENNLIKASQGLAGLKKKELARFFFDCPELVEKINNNSIRRASEAAIFYNQCKKNL